jgi:PHD/YefM family antitoxin component YafN of YafNO toxin-antitoxin module
MDIQEDSELRDKFEKLRNTNRAIDICRHGPPHFPLISNEDFDRMSKRFEESESKSSSFHKRIEIAKERLGILKIEMENKLKNLPEDQIRGILKLLEHSIELGKTQIISGLDVATTTLTALKEIECAVRLRRNEVEKLRSCVSTDSSYQDQRQAWLDRTKEMNKKFESLGNANLALKERIDRLMGFIDSVVNAETCPTHEWLVLEKKKREIDEYMNNFDQEMMEVQNQIQERKYQVEAAKSSQEKQFEVELVNSDVADSRLTLIKLKSELKTRQGELKKLLNIESTYVTELERIQAETKHISGEIRDAEDIALARTRKQMEIAAVNSSITTYERKVAEVENEIFDLIYNLDEKKRSLGNACVLDLVMQNAALTAELESANQSKIKSSDWATKIELLNLLANMRPKIRIR